MLKLMALDEEDLGILSFHLHNARLYGRDMLRQMREQSFLLAMHRFNWEAALAGTAIAGAEKAAPGRKSGKILPAGTDLPAKAKQTAKKAGKTAPKAQGTAADTVKTAQEIPAILQFDHVLAVRSYGIDRRQSGQVLSLKGLCFRPQAAPGGIITFLFAEKAGLELKVECIEARLQDLPAES
ncbi:MAG: DUF2948 family protein [Candidatus Tokpelaia sp.]|nr:MAG: DUF2948 family protein [Candidatus Tokpelaia sp.]